MCKHPEAKKGEVFLCNCQEPRKEMAIFSLAENKYVRSGFNDIGHSSKRLGKVAYNRDCEIISELYPCFISVEDAERVGYKHTCEGWCNIKTETK
jgi:hypothetical protein